MAKGSLRLKREPDYWELRAYAGRDPISGKKRYVTRVFRGGKREANSMLAQLVAEVDRAGPRTEGTVGYLLDAHIDHLAARGRQQRTIDGYRTIARAIGKDPLSAMPLKRVTVKSVDDFYNRLNHRKLSPSTIQRYHALLGAAFQQAMAWGWLPTNVVRLATPPSVPRISRKIPTPEVVAAILRAAEASRNPENHLAFRLLATTGARRGEICGVRWSAVDLDRSRISIREAIAHLASGELQHKDPKSHQIREVAVDARTAEMLREHRLDQLAYAANVRAELARDAFVLADLLTDPTGLTPIPPNRLTQAFRRIIERVPGAGKVRLHDLRHWFASTQLDAGEPLPAVAARIGDNVETLAKVYAHKGRRGDAAATAALSAQIDNFP
ncbi:MAG: site-specific integrase [Acidimicrobiales bacterium]